MGANESSLYHRISATESSWLAGLISQGRLTLPLITAEFNMEATRVPSCLKGCPNMFGLSEIVYDLVGRVRV